MEDFPSSSIDEGLHAKMTVTLRDVVLAVRYGDASLVGESAGYLILGAADSAARMVGFATLDAVSMSDEGTIKLQGAPCSQEDAEESLRHLLGVMLKKARTPCPNLIRVAERRNTRGLYGLIAELEAALIPVNRRAARRTLARLVRETKRSAAQERSFAEVQAVQTPPPPIFESSVAASINLTEREDSLPEAPAALAEVVPVVDTIQQTPEILYAGRTPTVSQAVSGEAREPESGFQHVGEHAPQAPLSGLGVSSRPQVMASLADGFMSKPDELEPELIEAEYIEPDVFEDDEFDEAPTQVFAGVTRNEDPVIAPAPEEFVRRARTLSGRAKPLSSRRQQRLSEDESLIPSGKAPPARRPSDISQLLDRMPVSSQSTDDLFFGLQSLSRVDLSPSAPPVGAEWMDRETSSKTG